MCAGVSSSKDRCGSVELRSRYSLTWGMSSSSLSEYPRNLDSEENGTTMGRLDATWWEGNELFDTTGLVLQHNQSRTLRTIDRLALHCKPGTENSDLQILWERNLRSLFSNRTLPFWESMLHFYDSMSVFWEPLILHSDPVWHLDLNHSQIIVLISRFLSLKVTFSHCISRSTP